MWKLFLGSLVAFGCSVAQAGYPVSIPEGYTPPQKYVEAREILERAVANVDRPITISVGVDDEHESFLKREADYHGWSYIALPLGYKYNYRGKYHNLRVRGIWDFEAGERRAVVQRTKDYVPLPPVDYRSVKTLR